MNEKSLARVYQSEVPSMGCTKIFFFSKGLKVKLSPGNPSNVGAVITFYFTTILSAHFFDLVWLRNY